MVNESAIDQIVDVFFSQVSADEAEEGVHNLFARSQHSIRPSELQSLAVQLRNLIAVDGQIADRELVSDCIIGNLWAKRVYLVQLERSVARWEFVLVRARSGWITVHFTFDQAAQDWF
jgi:hypothetical protein